MNATRTSLAVVVPALAGFLATTIPCAAQTTAFDQTFYRSSSFASYTCLAPCACPELGHAGPMQGTFRLVLVSIGDVFDFYAVENIDWFVRSQTGAFLHITGEGQYQRSDITRSQLLSLSLNVTPNVGSITFNSGVVPIDYRLPVIRVDIPGVQIGCSLQSLRLVAGPPAFCPADLDDGLAFGVPDGGVDINDLVYFLANFDAGNPAIDLSGGPCACVDCICPDGGVDINDLLFFLRRFEAGC